MAKFNPDVPQGNDPSYLGYSRETSGDKSMGTLFAGLGELFGTVVKGVDQENQQKIQGELSSGVQDVNNTFAALGTNEEAENQDEENTVKADSLVDVAGGDNLSATVPEASVAFADSRRLTLAMREGKITPEHYWSRMEVLSKKLKARYPGYSEIIDRQFQGTTGAIPANAYAQAQRKAYNATLTQATSEEKEWRNYVRANQQYLPTDYYKRIEEGNPYTQLDVYERVREKKYQEHEFKMQENKIAKETRQGNENKENAIGLASNKTNMYVDSILNDSASSMKGLNEMLKRAQENPTKVTPEEQMQLRAAFAKLRLTAEEGIDKILREPWDDKEKTYYSVIADPSKMKGIKEQALSRIDNFQKLIEDKDFGIVNSVANYNKATQDTATRKALDAHPYFSMVNAAKDLGGAELLNSMFLNPDYEKMKSDAAKAFRDVTMLKAVTGDTTSMSKVLEDAKKTADSLSINSQEQKKLYKAKIDDRLKILQSDNAPLESYQATATSLFGNENKDFLRVFPTREQRHSVYMKMTSPQMTAKMKELGKVDPSIYAQYKEWAKGGFLQLNQNLAATVQEGVVFREGIDVTFDPDSMHFVVGTTEKGMNRLAERAGGKGGLISEGIKGFEDSMQADTETAIQQLNRQIDNIRPILEDEKKDVGKELEGLFREMGVNTEAPKAKTFFQKARGAILNAIGKETKGSESTPADKEAEKQSAVRSFTQYARAGGIDAKSFLTRVRADGNENVEGLNEEFSGRLATMLQEAPQEVRDAVKVDSGYRSVDHQRKLWNAALAKYGSVRAARRWVAPPGHSYHGRGLAVDLKYASADAREWVRDNAKKYGLHFPLSNENWHIEMVGSRKPRKRVRTKEV